MFQTSNSCKYKNQKKINNNYRKVKNKKINKQCKVIMVKISFHLLIYKILKRIFQTNISNKKNSTKSNNNFHKNNKT